MTAEDRDARRRRRREVVWPAVVLATSFVATQIVAIIEFVAVH
ncbi:hypothetical protein GALL_117310 [mine drainage metagenome]|uniref:Uncharacterized protein n=1 Tax=mine drainage metagenome TaxID=410659 RepID=A0A1J5SCM6_9ZZZZ